jgi:hypothetical protein
MKFSDSMMNFGDQQNRFQFSKAFLRHFNVLIFWHFLFPLVVLSALYFLSKKVTQYRFHLSCASNVKFAQVICEYFEGKLRWDILTDDRFSQELLCCVW